MALDDIVCVAGRFSAVPGGAAYYCAAAAAVSGVRVALVATAGFDFPEPALEQLRAMGVSTTNVRRDESPCPRSRLVDPTGTQRTSAHHRDPVWWEAQRRLSPPMPPQGASAYVFNAMPAEVLAAQISARGPGDILVADTSAAFASAQANGVMALVPRLQLFAPSREETRILLPGLTDEDALAELAERMPIAVQKRGPDGLALRRTDAPELWQPTRATDVIDTTGAGDCVVGALAAGLVRGFSDQEMLARASEIASCAISDIGIRGLLHEAAGTY